MTGTEGVRICTHDNVYIENPENLWGLKCPPEVQVEHETCSTIFGTHVKAILDDEKLSGLAGGVREGKIWPRMHLPLRTGCKAVGFPALMRPPDGSRTLQNGPQMPPPNCPRFASISRMLNLFRGALDGF